MRAAWFLVLVAAAAHAAPRSERKGAAPEHAARGDAWMVAGRCDEAVKAYRQALALDAKLGTIKVRLAHCLAQTGQKAEALALLGGLKDVRSPAGAQALLALGDLAAAAGALKEAAGHYEALIARDPENLVAKLALLDVLWKLAEQGDAQAHDRALELAARLRSDPRADGATRRRAEELEAALKYGPAGKDLLEGKAKLALGDPKGASVALERAVAARPDLEEAFHLLGVAYASPELGRKDDARKAWWRAPRVKEARLALGVDAYEGGDLEDALAQLSAAVALDGRYQAAHYHLGLVQKERGDVEAAQRAWQKAISADPRSELGQWASTKLQVLTGQVKALAEGQVIDPSSEIGIGQMLARQVEARFGRIEDAALEAQLQKVLTRLSAVADRPERELRYRVVLVDVPMVNAITLPGGTILVFRGLVELVRSRMGGTDDAWGAVLGHEVAHAALRHGMGMIQVASSLSGKALAGVGDLSSLLNTVSRAHEFEADQFGALYAYRAGFNPAASLTLHEKMREHTGEIARGLTHPTYAERRERVRDYLLDLRAKVHGFELAVKALDKGDYDAAAARFEVFLGVFPDSTAARSNLGVALHRKALMALEPSSRFRKATDVDPDARARKIELRGAAGAVPGLKPAKIDQRLLRDAVAEYRSALQVDPTCVQAQVNLGAALDDLKDRKGARVVLEKVVRLAPGSKEAWNNLGAVAAQMGDAKRALEALGKATELDPRYADAVFNLALVQEQAGRDADAVKTWDRYLALDAKSGWAEVARAQRARLAK